MITSQNKNNIFMATMNSLSSSWTFTKRALILIIGYSCFAFFQWGVATLVLQQNYLLLLIIFAAPVVLALAFFSPVTLFGTWLILSPFLENFLKRTTFSFDKVLLAILLAAVIFKVFRKKETYSKTDYPMITLVIAYLYFWLRNAIYSNWDTHEYIFGIWGIQIFPIIVYYIAKNSINKKKDISIIFGFILIMCLLWISALSYEHFTGNQFIASLFGYSAELKRKDIGLGRVQGVGNAESLPGLIMCFTILVGFHCALFAKSKVIRSISWILVVLASITIFWTYTKNSYLAYFVLLLAMPLLVKAQRKIYIIIVSIFLLTILPLFFYMNSTGMTESLTRERNIVGRIAMNKAAINMIQHNFLFGSGNTAGEINKYIVDYTSHPAYKRIGGVQYGIPANDFLVVFAQYGLIGFLLLYGSIALIFIRLYKTRSLLADNSFYGTHLVNIALCYTVVFAVANLTRESQTSYYIPYCMFTLFGIATKLGNINHDKDLST